MDAEVQNFELIVGAALDSAKKMGLSKRKCLAPVKIFFALAKDEKSILEIISSKSILEVYAKLVVDIWLPTPRDTRIKDKEIVRAKLPDIFISVSNLINKGKQVSLFEAYGLPPTTIFFQEAIIEKLLAELEQKYNESKEQKLKDWSKLANPFLTTTIEQTLQNGETFQENAKLASSVETKWGNWIEKAINSFNPSLFYIGGGGIDFIIGDLAYDVKSGPNVMNKDQVEELKKKNSIIQEANLNEKIRDLLRVKEFKVAIAYGNRELSDKFMRSAGTLIIYGPETWETLTGDEWNAFKLFISGIKYKVERCNAIWTKADLEKAVRYFIQSFYMEDEEAYKKAISFDYYKNLESKINLGK